MLCIVASYECKCLNRIVHDTFIVTSVNPVHNAPVEQKKKKGPGSLIDTKNKTHQKKKKKQRFGQFN
jgi:hypothetical protein